MEKNLFKIAFQWVAHIFNQVSTMALEEDTYSIVFSALKHPSRRKIIRILAEGPNTYTELLTKLGVETGFLNYYLESLNGLIAKDKNDKYCISELGKSALGLVRQVEESVSKTEPRKFSVLGFSINIAYVTLAIISILVISNVYWAYALQKHSQEKTNLIGESILIINALLNESIGIIDTTMRESRINFHLWYTLVDDIYRISSESRLIKSLDTDHLTHWSQVELATYSLVEFVYDVFDKPGHQDYPYLNFTVGEGWIISLTKIRDDLIEINKCLPSNIVLGADPHVGMIDESFTKLLAAGLRLQQDVDMARRTVSVPKSLPNP
jgi:DNA-binding transcriptional ArsR family regulator